MVSTITEATQHIRPMGFGLASLRWYGAIGLDVMKVTDDGLREDVSHIIEMPWPMLKALHMVLGAMIQDYEADNGAEIPLPKAVHTPPQTQSANKK